MTKPAVLQKKRLLHIMVRVKKNHVNPEANQTMCNKFFL